MIKNFGDHSANERTFLAWLRTGISVVAFGVLIEKFNALIAAFAPASAERAAWLEKVAAPAGRYDGIALILLGVVLMLVAGRRFIKNSQAIDLAELLPAGHARTEVVLSTVLALLAAWFCVYVLLS